MNRKPSVRIKKRHGTHSSPGLQLLRRVWSVIDDLAAELVTHDDVTGRIQTERSIRATKSVSELVGVFGSMEIAATDAACESS
jgi:hypothetical protein